MKKKLSIGVAIIIMLIACVSVLSGCVSDDELAKEIEAKLNISEDGSFGYHVLKDKNGEKYAAFVRLTDEGKEKILATRKMYLPPFVGGYPLKQAGVILSSSAMGVIYYSTEVPVADDILIILPYTCEIKYNFNANSQFIESYDSQIEPPQNDAPLNVKSERVFYFFNHEGAPNKQVFLMDILKEGEVLGKIPYNPEHDGYEFVGWSLDFAGEKMIEENLYKSENLTRLFAQWKKK